jgi:hypothetical protein
MDIRHDAALVGCGASAWHRRINPVSGHREEQVGWDGRDILQEGTRPDGRRRDGPSPASSSFHWRGEAPPEQGNVDARRRIHRETEVIMSTAATETKSGTTYQAAKRFCVRDTERARVGPT